MKNWQITGDFHGNLITFLKRLNGLEKNSAVIILGDAGFNYYFSELDKRLKESVNARGIDIYCVRGNHEQRPEFVPGIKETWDKETQQFVYMEDKYPHIKYFQDGKIYNIFGLRALVIGGAYSVDKYYRLQNKWNWFPSEQLSEKEMQNIENQYTGEKIDIVLSHTCPLSWQPTDLFLRGLDQSSVDNSMEKWLENFRSKFNWNFWFFGHYHDDRIVRPHVEMFFNDIESLENIIDRWDHYDETGELNYGLEKDPHFYWE